MIARHEGTTDKMDIWGKLSAPLPTEVIAWRQDGRPIQRDGKFFARFVAYVEANTVRERLDSVVPGEWDLTLELLPAVSGEETTETQCSSRRVYKSSASFARTSGRGVITSRRRRTRSSARRCASESRTSCMRTSKTGSK